MRFLIFIFLFSFCSCIGQGPFYELPEGSRSCDENIAFLQVSQSNGSAASSWVDDAAASQKVAKDRGFIFRSGQLENYEIGVNSLDGVVNVNNFGTEYYLFDYITPFFQTVNVCKFAVGGAGVGLNPTGYDFNIASTGEGYDDLTAYVIQFEAAMDAKYGAGNWSWGGIVWVFGERDRTRVEYAQDFDENTKAIIDGLKGGFFNGKTFQNRLYEAITELGVIDPVGNAVQVRASQQDYCNTINNPLLKDNCFVIPTQDVTITSDGIHRTTKSNLDVSRRIAIQYLNFLAL